MTQSRSSGPATKPACLRLQRHHDLWLARTTTAMRTVAGYPISRSALLRCILDSIAAADIDFSNCDSETAICDVVLSALTRRNSAGRGASVVSQERE